MDRWVGLFKWLIAIGLVLLLTVGVISWLLDPASSGPLVVTPTLEASTSIVSSPSPPATLTPTRVVETDTPVPTWTLTPTPTATRTPRPSATPTPTATETPTPAPLAIHGRATLPPIANTPVVTSSYPQPSPMPLVTQPDGTVNILLLGMDRNEWEGTARTDVMMIASIFPDVPAVSLLSIPRDFYAWIPAWGLDKINTAYLRANRVGYPGGGPALAMTTVEYNFGVPIHYYAMVDFTSYRKIVDAVGGVDVVVECPLYDTFPDLEVQSGQTDMDLPAGVHHLSGKFALWYVRSRWSTSDFDRHRRQQQVLLAILRQARGQNMLVRLPELWEAYRESVETDLVLRELLTLATVASRLDERNISMSFVRGADVLTSWTAPNGGAVLVPNHETLYSLVQGAMQPLASSRAAQRAYRARVSNGSWSSAFGDVAAYRLGLEGLLVTEIEAVAAEPRTRIIDYTTTDKGSPIQRLVEIYRLQAGDVIKEPTEDSDVDFHVILGANYNPCHATNTAYWRPTPTPAPTPTPSP